MDSSPTRNQLLTVVDRLRTQMKKMEELFEAQDEERLQEIKTLLKERKELHQKVELLETKISNSDNFSSSLASSTTSSNPSVFDHEMTTITDSGCCGCSSSHYSHEMVYMDDYDKLQENYQLLYDEKTYLTEKVEEMASCLKKLQDTAEELQQKSDEQQEIIERLLSENQRLTFTNKDLYKAVTEIEQQKLDFMEEEEPVEPKSLFEELKDAGALDESVRSQTIEETVNLVEDTKEVELKKSPRLSFIKKPFVRFLSVFSVFADYLPPAPILHSLYSDVFLLQPNIS